MRSPLSALTLASSLALVGCAGPGAFVWFRDVPGAERQARAGGYVIAPGDVVSVSVYDQPALAARVRVRSDGKIAVPFAGEVTAAGQGPLGLSRAIEVTLQRYINAPRVTVNVEESAPLTVSVLGEVPRVGALTLPRGATVLDALAQAGGPSEFADPERIFLLRRGPTLRRIRFTYGAIVRNEQGAAEFPLATGDVLVVE